IAYPVPGNDDAIRSIKLFVSKFGEAVQAGLEKKIQKDIELENARKEEADSEEPEAESEESAPAEEN
ncbi:MAG: 30S ribosomal protein S2, partial [Candidatus Aminicenantes bacterium]|nr:30S ribosomal protein S2 [Candidatus Aminicenantes bacterium]